MPKRFVEFGENHQALMDIADSVGKFEEVDLSASLSDLLKESVNVLDLSEHQQSALTSVGINTVSQALFSEESTFQKAHYIGPVRSRKIKNVVTSAALEFLSG